MKNLFALLAAWIIAAHASAAPLEFGFIAAPAPGDPAGSQNGRYVTQSVSQTNGVHQHHPDAQLILLDNGAEKQLVDKGVEDFSWSLDGKTALVTLVTDHWGFGDNAHIGNADIYRLDVETGVRTRLTDQPSWQCQAVECGDGSIAYLSDEDGWMNPKGRFPAMTIWIMNADGTDKRRLWHAGLGGVFGLYCAPNGRLYFASGETQGLRSGNDGFFWSVWSINPDGSDFRPELTVGNGSWDFPDPIDFPAVTEDGTLVVAKYYPVRMYGTVDAVPTTAAAFGLPGPPVFENPDWSRNPHIWNGFDRSGINRITQRYSWQRRGQYNIYPDSGTYDFDSQRVYADGHREYVGFLSHPFAIPGNGVGFTWTGDKPPYQWNLGIYSLPNVRKQADSYHDFVKIVDSPTRHEWWGRTRPASKIVIPTPHGEVSPLLPPGSPYCIIGTSGVNYFESVKSNRPSPVLYPSVEDRAKYVRVLAYNPTKFNGAKFTSQVNEREGWLGDVPLPKWVMPDGSVVVDAVQPAGSTQLMRSDGKPDLSYAAQIPCDIPWSLQLLDAEKQAIPGTTAMTWHQAISREQRTNCQGCHAHWAPDPLPFDATYAGGLKYKPPILDRVKRVTLADLPTGVPSKPWAVAGGPVSFGSADTDWDEKLAATLGLDAKGLRDVRDWINTGFLEGAAAKDDTFGPTLVVDGGFVGAHDADSGLASLAINDAIVTLGADGRAALPKLTAGALVKFTAKDNAGNVTTRTMTLGEIPVPPPDDCEAEKAALRAQIDQLTTQLAALTAKLKAGLEAAGKTVETLK